MVEKFIISAAIVLVIAMAYGLEYQIEKGYRLEKQLQELVKEPIQ